MGEIDKIYETKVKYGGIFDFKNIYTLIFEWLSDMGYFVVEKEYSEKIKAEGKEIEIKWICTKKVTDYFRFIINVNWRIDNLQEIEITKEKKIRTNKGNIEIKFSAILERDWQNKYEVSPFHKFLRAVYEKYIIPNRIEQMEGKVTEEVLDIVNNIKAYLILEGKK
ncbi:MAG: hypothetical protein QXM27_01655 [Candidatus Pacearchaeota archaeon]